MAKSVYQGDTVTLKFVFNNEDGVPHDFTGQTLAIIIYHKKTKSEILESPLIIRDNEGSLILDESYTSNMLGTYEYYIRISNGIFSTIIETGELEVLFAPEFDGE